MNFIPAFSLAAALLSMAPQAHAQQVPAGVLTQDLITLKRNHLSIATDAGSFFEALAIDRDGQRINIGFFGGDAAAYFTERGLAQASLQTYRTKKIFGVSLWSAGMAALVADLGLSLHSLHRYDYSEERQRVQWSLLGAGVLTSLVGGVLLQSATGDLVDAVAQHNGTLLDEAIDQSMRPAVGMGSDGHGASVSLALPF